VWECADCGAEYKRHSRSIDPQRHRCGTCKAELRQTRPVPRQSKQPSEYQVFVKEHMKLIREENPGCAQKEIMRIVAERWAKKKEDSASATGAAVAADETKLEESSIDETKVEDVAGDESKVEATKDESKIEELVVVEEAKVDVVSEANKVDAVTKEMVDLTLKENTEA
jgi:hypothetical protein